MRVLVIGATGYLGRAIVRALKDRRHAPIAFARHASSAGLGCEAVDGDVTDAASVDRAVANCDVVCHTAALVSIWRRDPLDFDRVNVDGARHVFEAVARHGIGRCLYTSSFLARPPRGLAGTIRANDYQRTKARALGVARECAGRGVPIVTFIPGVVYGPGLHTEGNLVGRLLRDRVNGRLPGIVGPDRIWSFSYVDDVARAHAAAVDAASPEAEYGVGGENLPQRAVFDWLASTHGIGAPRSIPPALARAAGWVDEQRARLTGRTPMLTRGAVEIFAHDWPVDSTNAMRDLGYRITPLAEGLAATWASLAADGSIGPRG